MLEKYQQEILFAVDENYEINFASPQVSLLTGKDSSLAISTVCYEELMGRTDPCPGCPLNLGDGNVTHDLIIASGGRRFYSSNFKRDEDNGLLVESMSDITAFSKEIKKYRHEAKKLKAAQVAEQLQNHTTRRDYDFLINIINKQSYGLLVANRDYSIVLINDFLSESALIKSYKYCYEVYGNKNPCQDCPYTHSDVKKSSRTLLDKKMTVTYSYYNDYLVESVRDSTREVELINDIRIFQDDVQEKQRQMELLNRDLLRMNNELKIAQTMIDDELKQVGELQQSLLPESLPVIPGYEFGAFYIPAEHAGGDYYDCIQMSNAYWGFVVADVSGHGAPAAVIMAMARAIMRSYTYDVISPADALGMVNEILCDNVYTNDFVTMFYTVLDSQTGKLNYASAGHNPMLHFDKSNMIVRPLKADGMFLAAFPGIDYEEKELTMEEGDILFLYTDGLVEAMNPKREQYSMDRVISHIIMYNDLPCDEIVAEVMADVRRFTENAPLDDDVTIFVIKKITGA